MLKLTLIKGRTRLHSACSGVFDTIAEAECYAAQFSGCGDIVRILRLDLRRVQDNGEISPQDVEIKID